MTTTATLHAVKEVLAYTLGVEERLDSLDADTPLFGSLPELDSMAVVELIAALEDRFGILVEDDEVTADVFDTLASLSEFVDSKIN